MVVPHSWNLVGRVPLGRDDHVCSHSVTTCQRCWHLWKRWLLLFTSEVAQMRTIVLILLVLLLIAALPTWPYSSGWGYYPSGGLGLVLIIIIVLVLLGRI